MAVTVRVLVAALVLLTAAPPAAWSQSAPRIDVTGIRDRVRNRIEAAGVQAELSAGPERIHTNQTLPRFYQGRLFRPAWVTSEGLSPTVDDLLRALRTAPAEGLRAEDYHLSRLVALTALVRGSAERPDPAVVTSLDLLLTDAFLLYGSHLLAGRVDPVTVDPEWHADRPDADLAAVLEGALQGTSVARALDALRPQHPHYARLKATLADFRDVGRRGGWPVLPDLAGTLERGTQDPAVVQLRERLAASRDLTSETPDDPERFDDVVDEAVHRFQRRHGLDMDGVVGPATLAALNVPVADRIRQITANLERWRWLPQDLGDRYLLVNIPAFELEIVEGLEPVLTMRVIVGRDYRRTPVFSGSMTYLVLNPYWHVPRNIAVQDILPRLQKDPGYLATQGMRVFPAGGAATEVNASTVDWTQITRQSFPYQLRQDPGPLNALGSVKFMFPNPFNVYLHDTPSRELFGRTERSFSSGCIRVEHPIELTAFLLDDSAWTESSVNQALTAARDRTVRLNRALPVHLLYWTAWADDDGPHFRRDLYDRDAPLLAALAAPPPTPANPVATR